MIEKIICYGCNSEYEVTWEKVIVRDRDKEECRVFGATLESWDGSSIPRFRLIKNKRQS